MTKQSDLPDLFNTIEYPESLQVSFASGKGDTVIHPEDQPLHTDVELRVVAIGIFGEVVGADDLVQLKLPEQGYRVEEISGKIMLHMCLHKSPARAKGIKWQEMETARRWVEGGILVTGKMIVIHKV